MGITRTHWIDDDGSGTTGTIINDAEKQLLYDQIDATLPVWTDTPFDPANFWPGVEASHVSVNRWAVVGKVCYWMVAIYGAPPPPAGTVYLRLMAPRFPLLPSASITRAALAQDSVSGFFEANVYGLDDVSVGVGKLTGAAAWEGTVTTYFSTILALA